MKNLKENMNTRLENNTDSINNVLEGIKEAAKIITSTMGGTGKNVLIFENGDLHFTKDGVSVAKKIKFTNKEKDAGAQLLINAANNTVLQCGDGTTLTSLLVNEFVQRLFEEIKEKPVNDVLDYTKSKVQEVIEKIKEQSVQVESYEEIYKIALTSCKSESIARLIESVYRKTGFNASISVEHSENLNKTYPEITNGLTFDSGLINNGFSNQENGNCSFEKPEIHVFDEVLSDTDEFQKVADYYNDKKIPLVILAPDYSDGFIRWALFNKINKNFQICLLKLPGYGYSVSENIKDLKAFLNGNSANKITITPMDFTVYNNPDKKKIRNRVKQLTSRMEVEVEDFVVIDYQKRIHRLNQTAAIIYVGGVTRKTADEEYDRIEDAVGACKSALVEGYVEGQGISLMKLDLECEDWFRDILKSPYFTILGNARLTAPKELIPYNVRTRQYDTNLVDPSLVLIKALENSFALAELLINTSYTLHD